jgi:hypothetical protein
VPAQQVLWLTAAVRGIAGRMLRRYSRSRGLGSLAPLKSRALCHRQTRVARKGCVPCGARATQVGGAPPRLVELRMPACFTKPRLCAELQPRGIRRPVRHERQDMRLAWQGVSCHTQVRGRLPAGRGTCRDPFHRLSGRCGGSRHMPKITRFHRPGRQVAFETEQCGPAPAWRMERGAPPALARHAGPLRGFAPRGHTMGG